MKNIKDMNKQDLRAACKEYGIKNYSKMNNDAMRKAVREVKQDFDLIEQYGHITCPHCGVHLDNGISMHGDIVEDKPLQNEEFIYECMGCGGEFGPAITDTPATPAPKGTGIKIEKDREERNGVKRPSAGGACRAVWDLCDELLKDTGVIPTASIIKEAAVERGLNANNASIELYQWRKFHGIRGRQKVQK